MKLVLVRHGYTVGNDLGTYTGWSNTPLSEQGIRDLKQYRETYDYPMTDRYYTSDLQRTIDTFQYIYEDRATITESCEAFREVHFGDYEDVHASEISGVPYNTMYVKNVPYVNGETISQVALRLFGKLTAILRDMEDHQEDSLTIVCHSGVIKTLLLFLSPTPFEQYLSIDTPNGLGYILDIDFDRTTNGIDMKSYKDIPLKD